ncbi:hypothetical protein LK994_12040 [Ferruginibacter lapsinanis]|uniref:hypothetical protein n=1 Tax=Ferruginibacter lapsinanis TaxID=563172 RepID=UPI001E2FC141|nr:hypothetical protein [Ferruginibacter lapsinanis]UEG49362.1 hypothetical protein LK994_12040 [Ferruginibacter lapsinanis]
MTPTKQSKTKQYLVVIGAFLFMGFVYEKLGCTDTKDKNGTSTETVKNEIPSMTEGEYLKYFQDKWDAVKLETEGQFPQYEDYQVSLENVLQEILSALQKDPSFKVDSPSKLNKLRQQLIDSKKMKTAISNYLTYGQPMSDYALKDACQTYLEQYANDPNSIDIENYKILKQSKKGWVVVVKYRGKNAFGGLVLNISTFDVRFNPSEKIYYAVSAN